MAQNMKSTMPGKRPAPVTPKAAADAVGEKAKESANDLSTAVSSYVLRQGQQIKKKYKIKSAKPGTVIEIVHD